MIFTSIMGNHQKILTEILIFILLIILIYNFLLLKINEILFVNYFFQIRNNLHYIIFSKLDKKEINLLYQDISLDISLNDFQKINNDLKIFENIIIDKKTEYGFFKLRKNLDEIYIA